MGLQQRRRTRALRVLYGATKPLPRPKGKYHVPMTYDEQMTDFEAASRRSGDRNWREQRASAAAMKAITNARK